MDPNVSPDPQSRAGAIQCDQPTIANTGNSPVSLGLEVRRAVTLIQVPEPRSVAPAMPCRGRPVLVQLALDLRVGALLTVEVVLAASGLQFQHPEPRPALEPGDWSHLPCQHA